jgi:hypothetical protein
MRPSMTTAALCLRSGLPPARLGLGDRQSGHVLLRRFVPHHRLIDGHAQHSERNADLLE